MTDTKPAGTPPVEETKAETDVKTADIGKPTPRSLRALAQKLPDDDPVKKATKDAMLADTAQEEAKHKAKVVDASPNAGETPSGRALKKVTGVSNDTERGELYAREKTAVRWGYVPVDEA